MTVFPMLLLTAPGAVLCKLACLAAEEAGTGLLEAMMADSGVCGDGDEGLLTVQDAVPGAERGVSREEATLVL